MSRHAFSDPLVTAGWLNENLSAPDVRVVDATWTLPWVPSDSTARERFNSAHIPGASYFDIDEIADTASPYPHMLPSAEKFSSAVRKMGLGDGHRIVVYDANGFFASARVWWMFRVMGHEDIAVLDGGLQAWQEVGYAVEDLPTRKTERHFTVRMRADLLRNREQVEANIGNTNRALIDARPEGRFKGTAPEPRPELRGGHIPGSLSFPHSKVLDDHGRMKSADELREIFADVVSHPLITCTCGSGVSAAVLALALARIGRWDAAVYDGSWSEWGALDDTPVETG